MLRLLWIMLPLLIVLSACTREPDTQCLPPPQSELLKFRLTDTAGNDLLRGGMDSVTVTQPCRTAPVQTSYQFYYDLDFKVAATIVAFTGFTLPVNGKDDAGCFRFYLRFPGGDVDTLDWAYHVNPDDLCKTQVIDKMQYNGVESVREMEYGRSYYRLVKR